MGGQSAQRDRQCLTLASEIREREGQERAERVIELVRAGVAFGPEQLDAL
jgi:hypothetical protein